MIAAQVLAVLVGVVGVGWILISVIRTVVIPRPERVWLTTALFDIARRFTRSVSASWSRQARHQLLGAFAPTVLISLPLVWSFGLVVSFSAIFWGMGVGSPAEAIELSGSSITTLGFVVAPSFVTRLLAIVEALIGLAIVALMISFLPTLYGTFSRREVAVGRLATRAGEPPNPVEFIVRMNSIDQLASVSNRWEEWENWFVELGETHTTFPALIYFRSAHLERSWVTSAESALDAAGLMLAAGLVTNTGPGETMIRSGYLALRSVADFYRIQSEHDPSDLEMLSVYRPDFETMLDQLEKAGVVGRVDRDTAWKSFAGWRVNYDMAVNGIRELVWDLPTYWTARTVVQVGRQA